MSYLPSRLADARAESDGLDKPYWEATRRGELLVQRCKACGTFQWGPEWICHKCLSFDMTGTRCRARAASTAGSGLASGAPGAEGPGPYVVVLVELPDAGNVRMLGNLLATPSRKSIGADGRRRCLSRTTTPSRRSRWCSGKRRDRSLPFHPFLLLAPARGRGGERGH